MTAMNNRENQVIIALSGKFRPSTCSIYCMIGFQNVTV
jgi:hypothetical protein